LKPTAVTKSYGPKKDSVMLTESQVKKFAAEWLHAWNSHDLNTIMSHYGSEIVLTSPTAAKLMNDSAGTVTGVLALRNYFKRGLEAYPNLAFELLDVMWGLSSVILYYKNQNATTTGEFMELDANLKVTRVVANYSR
jgi:SnoaL-like domain